MPHVVPVDSTVHLGSREVTCRGASMLPGAQLDLPDLGLVEAGTQCGPRMVSPAHPAPRYHLSPMGQSLSPPHCRAHTAYRCARKGAARTLLSESWSSA